MSQGAPGKKSIFSKLKGDKKIEKKTESDEICDKVEEEILSKVEEGQGVGALEENEAEMISNILEFGDKEANDIMTSRQKIVALEKNTSVNDAFLFALENSYSRYPVYEEEIDMIIGVVHIKDIMQAYLKDKEKPIASIVDTTMYVHPTYEISKLLKKMQKEKIHMAVVIDEYGQTEGIVTMEDIVEEIVGNILDEHDKEENNVHKIANNCYIVDGLIPLSDLEELIGDIEFPDDLEINTLNGFMLYKLERLPKQGERVEIEFAGYRFLAVKIEKRMIKQVKILKNMN